MSVIVQKYGGSSVADVQKLKAVAARVMRTRAQGHDVVVVVSAMGDTTDELLTLAKQVSANPDRRELDMLLSAGERISMALLSMAIRELGGNAISFTGSQSGIITNDRHVDARIIEVRPFRIQDELARGRIVVVAGYQGVSYKKEVTTLGRGGSDTTAVAMAAALDAEFCEICSDVDGVYSADPRVVPAARRIASLSYEETQEMAEAGAKVLNAQAVEFAKEKGIAIYARATQGPLPGPDPSSDGTVVRRGPPRMPGTVVGVASERDVIVLDERRRRRRCAGRCSTNAGSPANSFTSSTTARRWSSRARTCTTRIGCARPSTHGRQPRTSRRWSCRRQRRRRRHQRDLPERARGQRDTARGRHRAARNGDLVVQDYVDGSRESGWKRPCVRCTGASSSCAIVS